MWTTTDDLERIDVLVERCAADGVITAEQADVLRDYARAGQPSGPRRLPALEVVGYLGGLLCLVGAVLVGARYWGDLGMAWRTATLGLSTVVLLAAGAVVRGDGAAGRLRSVFWLVALGCLAGLLAVVGDQVLDLDDRDVALLVAAGCAACAGVLWVLHPTPVQQVAMVVAVAATAAAVLHELSGAPDLPGVGVWATGVGWALCGRAGVLCPRRMATLLGAAMAVLGAMFTAGSDAGMVLTTATVVAVLVVSVLERDLALLAVGAVGTVLNLPAALARWFPDSVAAALGLVVGLVLVAVAATIAVRRRGTSPDG